VSRRKPHGPARGKRADVGYGRPPPEHQFKPGQSGNPRGRPKKYPTLLELFADEFKRMRTIVEDGERHRVQTDKILVKRIIDLALKGDMKALRMMMALIEPIREIENARIEHDTSDMSLEELAADYARLRETIGRETAASVKQITGSFP
jgi:hypothetical protein